MLAYWSGLDILADSYTNGSAGTVNFYALRPGSDKEIMNHRIKILRQMIIQNEVAKVGSVHTVPSQIAHMHVMAGNTEYVMEGATTEPSVLKTQTLYLSNGLGRNEGGYSWFNRLSENPVAILGGGILDVFRD